MTGDYTSDFLAVLVRDQGMMSLEDAHWKLSKYSAHAAGMQDRGALAVGMPADVLVYDLKALRVLDEEIAYDFPGGGVAPDQAGRGLPLHDRDRRRHL